jgi:hypothetical protein
MDECQELTSAGRQSVVSECRRQMQPQRLTAFSSVFSEDPASQGWSKTLDK